MLEGVNVGLMLVVSTLPLSQFLDYEREDDQHSGLPNPPPKPSFQD